MTWLLRSSAVGLLLASCCVAGALGHWAARAWDMPRRWGAVTVTTSIASGGLLLALTITRFALLGRNGG